MTLPVSVVRCHLKQGVYQSENRPVSDKSQTLEMKGERGFKNQPTESVCRKVADGTGFVSDPVWVGVGHPVWVILSPPADLARGLASINGLSRRIVFNCLILQISD